MNGILMKSFSVWSRWMMVASLLTIASCGGGNDGTGAAGSGGAGASGSAGRGGTGGTAGASGSGGGMAGAGIAGSSGGMGGAAGGDPDGGTGDGSPDGSDDGSTDGSPDGAGGSGGDGGVTDAGPDLGPPQTLTFTVMASLHTLALDACTVTPAEIPNVAAGEYNITLTASSLSKGSVSGTPQLPATDPYVIVNLPIPAGDPHQYKRFFMLNGVAAAKTLTMPVAGTIRLMFIDTDAAFNAGEGTVTLNPGGTVATVYALNHVLRHGPEGCASTPASLRVSDRLHRATLTASTLSSGAGFEDPFVILRLPSERPDDPHRYVMLNAVGSSHDFTPYNSDTLRAWFISSTGGGSGQATITVTDL